MAPETFIGRERELQALDAGLSDALAGRGRLLMLVGEAGIGKTRIADELASTARRQKARVLWGSCWEGDGAPAFWPWTQVVRAYVQDREATALKAEMGPGAADIAQVIPDVCERLPDLRAPSVLESAQEQFRLFDSMTTFLKNAAKAQPLVLIFDDLHWADRSSLLLLHFLARELRDARLLVVGAYRDVELPDNSLAELISKLTREGQRIDLRGLNEAEVSRLIEPAWGAKPPAGLVATLHHRTEGNPFFVTEMVGLLASQPRPARPEEVESWAVGIPHGVRQTIRCHLDKLSRAHRRVLAVASVIGREFGLDVLDRISPEDAEMRRTHLLEAVDAARATAVVSEVPNLVRRYRFSHALVRETLYDDLPTPERLRLHYRIGTALEELAGAHPEPYLAELAHHFCMAAPSGHLEKAIHYAVRAGDQCSSRVAYEEAVRHYERAAQCHALQLSHENGAHAVQRPEDTLLREQCEILLALGHARYRAGAAAKAIDCFKSVADLARRVRAPDLLGRAAIGAAGRWGVRSGMDPSALALLDEAASALGEGVTAVHVGVLSRLGMALQLAGPHDRSVTLVEQAVQLARQLGEPGPLAYALDARRFVRWRPENCEERLAAATEINALADKAGDTEMVLWNHLSRLIALLELGDMQAADAEIQTQAQMAADLRQPFYLWITVVHRAMRALLQGRLEEAEGLITEAHAMGRRVQRETATQIFGVQMFVLRGEQGRLHELADGVMWFVEHYPTAPAWRAGLAHVYSETGRLADARREFDYLATNRFHSLPSGPDWLIAVVLLAQVCNVLDDAARAAELYDLLLPYARRNVVLADMAACFGSASRTLGMLATTMRRWEDAAQHFEDALRMNARMTARPYTAHTQHAYASMLLTRGRPADRDEARQRLAAAIATYEELGMQSYRDKAIALRDVRRPEHGVAEVYPSTAPAQGASVFREEGDYWTISYEGTVIRQRNTKGLRYMAQLLRYPGKEFHVADLLLAAECRPEDRRTEAYRTMSDEQLGAQGLSVSRLSGGGAIPDARAKAEYRRRLGRLQDELEEAEQLKDSVRAVRAREELDFIGTELDAGHGFQNARQSAAPVEKIRKAVSNRIRADLARIQKQHPSLWRHLFSSIKMGTFCSYAPQQPVTWQF